jgi:type I restriction enzyme, S subunit
VAAAEWETVPLGAVATVEIERVAVQADTEYRLVGVSIAGQGLFWRTTIRGRETNYSTLNRLRAGQVVMRKLTAWEGPITTVPREFEGGYVSSEFPTFTLDEARLLPEYMRLVCRMPAFHAEMRRRSTGTAERRNRLKPEDLLSIELLLPGIEEQRAVVQAAAACEAVVVALRAESSALADLHAAAREQLLENLATRKLGEVLDGIDGGLGAIPKCEDRPPNDGEWGIVKVSAVRPGRFYPQEAKTLPPAVAITNRVKIQAGDVLVTRCSGSTRFVGAACRVDHDPHRLVLSDFVLRLRFTDAVDPDFMVEALATNRVRQQIEGDIERSTTLRSVSKARLRSLDIPCPSPEHQETMGDTLRRLRDAENRTAAVLDSAEKVYLSFVSSLVAGRVRMRVSDASARMAAV